MIGSDDDRALLRRRQRVEQPPDGVVHDRHLGQVGVTAGPLEERARSFVRRVGIEEVHPEEEAVVDPATREPREGSIDRLIGAALEHVLPGGLLATGGAVEDLEALIQAEGPVHHGRGDERGGAAAGVEGRLGERPRLVGERRQPVVPQPVPRREEAGEHRRVRGQSERGDGPRRVEDLRLAAERSKARRDPSILPVEIERARVGRVEGHEHERAGAAEGRAAHVVPSASAQPEAGERTEHTTRRNGRVDTGRVYPAAVPSPAESTTFSCTRKPTSSFPRMLAIPVSPARTPTSAPASSTRCRPRPT